jgi:transcriptional regulator with XRE-family HTH domain
VTSADNLTNNELSKMKQLRAGEYLASLRTERRLTQKIVASQISVSFQYLSEIEKGNKSPTDLLLHQLAEVFKLDLKAEVELFHRYGKIPLLVKEELEEQPAVQLALAELRMLTKSGKITQKQRLDLYDNLGKVYQDFIARLEQSLPQ